MIRSFIAIDLTPDVRRGLGAAQQKLRAALEDEPIRWVRPEGIHLTLKFLGDQPPDRIERIGDVLSQWAQGGSPLDLEIGSAGAFPDMARPRVLWVGVHEPSGRLVEWVDRLEKGLEGLGIRKEDRPFHPHLTLARVKERLTPRGLETLRGHLESLKGERIGEQRAEAATLFRSDLRPSGAVYTVLLAAPLGRVKPE
ncbi:MAG TPA: RNA 2',3'-cyclic phosphodiesterase [Anaerolineales bacterium]|nr:RNA 2',3'-cyclic phosphodiesterase [Anaerolineales bacterium]